MPAWWGRKSSKHKEEHNQSPQGNSKNSQFGFLKSPAKNDSRRPKSFDEVQTRGSPRLSRDFASAAPTAASSSPAGRSSSGFTGFGLDESRCHPLPRPGNDHGGGLVSGWASGSSVSSSVSSSEDQTLLPDGPCCQYRLVLMGSLMRGL